MSSDNRPSCENAGAASAAAAVIATSRIVVVKVGSALLIDPVAAGLVRADWLAALAADLAALRSAGTSVLVVTSGAIALGRARLGLEGPLRLEEKQAASAAGQAALINAWGAAFAPHGAPVAQVLLTLEDTENRRRYLNARQTLKALLDLGAAPVINENDTVATAEIRYGDNDRLAAHAAQLIGADCLIILSDIDGLYTADPASDPKAEHIPVIERLTPEIEALAGPPRAGAPGSGGMATKIAAARLAAANGCATIIAPGRQSAPVSALRAGGRATLIRTALTPASARKAWIANRLRPAGDIVIDAGALAALRKGASLLPAGVTGLSGAFRRGDAVRVIGPGGAIAGQGLVGFDADEVGRLIGRQSGDLEAVLGPGRRPLVIDRNNLVLKDDEERSGAGDG